jgi:hypothetical protein
MTLFLIFCLLFVILYSFVFLADQRYIKTKAAEYTDNLEFQKYMIDELYIFTHCRAVFFTAIISIILSLPVYGLIIHLR